MFARSFAAREPTSFLCTIFSPAWPPVVERVDFAPRYDDAPAQAAADAAASLGDRVRTSHSGVTVRRQ